MICSGNRNILFRLLWKNSSTFTYISKAHVQISKTIGWVIDEFETAHWQHHQQRYLAWLCQNELKLRSDLSVEMHFIVSVCFGLTVSRWWTLNSADLPCRYMLWHFVKRWSQNLFDIITIAHPQISVKQKYETMYYMFWQPPQTFQRQNSQKSSQEKRETCVLSKGGPVIVKVTIRTSKGWIYPDFPCA